ncbi:LUD domain-containing protein [soil metagenome]
MDPGSDALTFRSGANLIASRRGIRQEPNRAEQIAGFSALIAPLGVQVHHALSVADAADIVRETAAEVVASEVLVSSELLSVFPGLEEGLPVRGLVLRLASNPEESLDAPLGLTTARNAIAETGSVLMSEATLADRSVALLSLTCLVMLPSSAMIPSLDDAAMVLRTEAKKPGGAYSTLVTGPSRTADIELSLTVGVQGPGRMIVVFVDHE